MVIGSKVRCHKGCRDFRRGETAERVRKSSEQNNTVCVFHGPDSDDPGVETRVRDMGRVASFKA